MSEDEFWKLTHIEFQALMERWEEKEHRRYFRAGTIAAAALNPYRDTKEHPESFTAFDFFNIPRPKPKPQPKPTKAELVAKASGFFAAHNANVARREKRRARA